MNQKKKIRADAILVQLGLAPTRTRAQSLIMSGVVYHGTQRIEKSSQLFHDADKLVLKGKDHPYVGRGGVKLKAALDAFKIDVRNKICLDVGASTGGFTDCLLKAGAKKVYALDVGYGQMDWSLAQDKRVVVIDRTNFRHFDPAVCRAHGTWGGSAADPSDLTDPPDIVTIDASFISLKLLIPKAVEILMGRVLSSVTPNRRHRSPTGTCWRSLGVPHLSHPPHLNHSNMGGNKFLILLIKPQFEVGKKHVGKGGIVKDEKKRDEAVLGIKNFCIEIGLRIIGVIPSPILGQEGNREYLLVACL